MSDKKRITIILDLDTHRSITLAAAKAKLSLQEYILMLLKNTHES